MAKVIDTNLIKQKINDLRGDNPWKAAIVDLVSEETIYVFSADWTDEQIRTFGHHVDRAYKLGYEKAGFTVKEAREKVGMSPTM